MAKDLDDRIDAAEAAIAALQAQPPVPADTTQDPVAVSPDLQSLVDRITALETQAQTFISEDSSLMVRVSKLEVEVFPPAVA